MAIEIDRGPLEEIRRPFEQEALTHPKKDAA
jgi:hypothetical protein